MEQYYPSVIDPLGIDYHTFDLTIRQISLAAHEHGLDAAFARQSWVQLAKLVQMTFQHDSYIANFQDVVPRQFSISYIRWTYCILLWKDLFPGRPLPWHFARTTKRDKKILQGQFVCPQTLFRALSLGEPYVISWSINSAYHTILESNTSVEYTGVCHGLGGILLNTVLGVVRSAQSFTCKARRHIEKLLSRLLPHRYGITLPLWHAEQPDNAWRSRIDDASISSTSLNQDERYTIPCGCQVILARHRSFS
ncbi:hypothetical protein F5X99DRAFT_405791 [Biscogniauxia marginata]|nr:hypothetical protein F5X99DRAFT_405791 [Biscogniauxia marginata]